MMLCSARFSVGSNARLATPTVLTVSVDVALSYRHMQPKSMGRSSSTLAQHHLEDARQVVTVADGRGDVLQQMQAPESAPCERNSDCWICVSM